MTGSYKIRAKQGDYLGGGVSLGRQFFISRKFLLDIVGSLSFLSFYNTEKFNRIEEEEYSSNYLGITGVSISLVMKIN